MKTNRQGQEIDVGVRVRFHGREGTVIHLLNRADADVVISGLDQHGQERAFHVDHNDCEVV